MDLIGQSPANRNVIRFDAGFILHTEPFPGVEKEPLPASILYFIPSKLQSSFLFPILSNGNTMLAAVFKSKNQSVFVAPDKASFSCPSLRSISILPLRFASVQLM